MCMNIPEVITLHPQSLIVAKTFPENKTFISARKNGIFDSSKVLNQIEDVNCKFQMRTNGVISCHLKSAQKIRKSK